MKKILIVAGIILGLVLTIAIVFYFRFQQMTRIMEAEVVTEIDLATIEDGVYTGEYGEFLVYVKVEVTVDSHTITAIDIIDQRAGPGYEATETVDQILEAQSPDVDGVSGATGSSRSIMIAVRNALTDQ